MVNIIKTAIITIVISFISGVLLDYYKNLAPRILCTIGNAVPLTMNGTKFFTYIITVVNISKKTIHDLNINVQSSKSDLKITDGKITKGLKFDSSVKDNILDVHIPFLSKNDKFSVTVYVENPNEVHNKPVIVIRSPENFKRIDSAGEKGVLALLLNIPENIIQAVLKIIKNPKKTGTDKRNNFTTDIDKSSDSENELNKGNSEVLYETRKLGKVKKAMIITVPIILLVMVGFLGKSYFKGVPANTSNSTVNTALPSQSTGSEGSESKETTKNKNSAESGGYSNTNNSTESSNRNTSTNSSIGGTPKSTDSSSSTKSSGTSSESKGTSTPTGSSLENKSTNTSSGSSSGNIGTNAATSSSSENTVTNTPSGESSGSKSTNASSGASTGTGETNSSAGSSTGTSTENTSN